MVDVLREGLDQISVSISRLLDDELIRSIGSLTQTWPLTAVHSYLGGAKSNNKFTDSVRLWYMFNTIFSVSSEFDSLQSTFPHFNFSNYLGKLKPKWYRFLTSNKLTRNSLNRLDYEDLPEIPQHDLRLLESARSSLWPESHEHAARLQQALELRKRSGYEDAVKLLTENHLDYHTDIFVLLKLQSTLLSQRNYLKARDCQLAIHKAGIGELESSSTQQMARRLLDLVSVYADGFVHGRWSEALNQAFEVFKDYLRSWQTHHEDKELWLGLWNKTLTIADLL